MSGTTRAGRRWRRVVVAGSAVLALAAVAGCSGNPAALGGGGKSGDNAIDSIISSAPVARTLPHSPTLDRIKKDGKLIYGGTNTAPLFSLKDPITGQLTGFDATMAKMLAKYITGQPATQLTQITVDTREALLQNHSVNVVFATYTITPKRAQKVNFAGPYYMSGASILVRKDNKNIKKVSDLNGKTVVTESASTAANTLRQLAPRAQVQLFPENNDCVQAVQQKRADAYVLDQGILIGDAVKNTDVKVVGQPFTAEPYGIGLPKDDPVFKQVVNDWLKQIIAAGLWPKLWKATVGTIVPGDAPTPPKIGSVPGS